ncbi:hypothetical protein ACVWYG_000230 [Pedobacter sp. UYEF25]
MLLSIQRMACVMLLGILYSLPSSSQDPVPVTISLNSLDAFRDPPKNWIVASDASADFGKSGPIKSTSGSGVLVNTFLQNGANLVTKLAYGDVELELDFMMTKGAASGVYLLGRYEVQLADSWTKLNPTFADLGAVGRHSGNSLAGFNGKSPLMNVSRAPGLWQHLRIKFSAPKFANGIKVANARFEEVYLNNAVIQEHVDVTAPTEGAMFIDEHAEGPIMLQGDQGSVAFRNIITTHILPVSHVQAMAVPNNPILLNPTGRAYILRSFLNYGDRKRTHVISVGNPNQISYSYDLKQGALLQIWRGQFVDVTDMWDGRGEPQVAKPNGSVVLLSGAPSIAFLADANSLWPDSIAFDDFDNKGYALDKDRNPTFRYVYKGATVTDKISSQGNGESLIREINVSNAPANFYCRIAAASIIEAVGKGIYAVDGKSYYVRIDKQFKPFVRKTQKGQELIIGVEKNVSSFTYSIIW